LIQFQTLPHDVRGFVHKKLFGAAKGFLTGGPTGAIGGFLSQTSPDPRRNRKAQKAFLRANPLADPARAPDNRDWRWQGRPSEGGQGWVLAAGERGSTGTMPVSNLAGTSNCIWPTRPDPATGKCSLFLGDRPGPDGPGTDIVPFGDAVQGAFGMPAMRPNMRQSVTMSCPSGMVLGRDDLCYPKAVLRRDSKFRKWRPGRRPVLTGGELAAISKARRAITRGREVVSSLGITVKKK